MKKPLIVLVILAALGLGYWLISPLFINKEVQEALPPDLEKKVEQAIADYKENIEAQVSPEKMEEFKKQLAEMMLTPDETMDEPMPESSQPKGPTVIAAGSFADVAHEGSGEAKFIYLGDLGIILRLENLDVLNGPDLRVLISKNSNITKASELGEYIELGELKGNKGTQNYEIPSGVVVSDYHSVVIYCKPFRVVFNAATLVSVQTSVAEEKPLAGEATGLKSAGPGDIMFGWEVQGGAFQSIIIDKSGTYNTFVDNHPFEYGSWTFANGTLTLKSAVDEAFSKTFTNVLVSENKKTLQVTRNGKIEVWVRQ